MHNDAIFYLLLKLKQTKKSSQLRQNLEKKVNISDLEYITEMYKQFTDVKRAIFKELYVSAEFSMKLII